jgi:hypothetical protein
MLAPQQDVKRPGQFGLTYLFLETFWIAAALACFTQFHRFLPELQTAVLIYGWLCSGIALGGLFGRMSAGFQIALGLLAAVGIAMLAVIAAFLVLG